jgi:hypothetical protein
MPGRFKFRPPGEPGPLATSRWPNAATSSCRWAISRVIVEADSREVNNN